MHDLPIPEAITKFLSPELGGELPTPKALGGLGEEPVPLPLDQLMELAVAATQILPVPQPIEQLTNKL